MVFAWISDAVNSECRIKSKMKLLKESSEVFVLLFKLCIYHNVNLIFEVIFQQFSVNTLLGFSCNKFGSDL